VHKTRPARLLFEELNITKIFNVLYCPQFNGEESYFAQVKATYKKLLLQHVVKDVHVDTKDLIRWSMERVSGETATRCVRYALA
jgi:hypothetical protein